jgi:hypothetical protein
MISQARNQREAGAQRYIAEVRAVHNDRCENLTSYIFMSFHNYRDDKLRGF